MTFQLYLRTLIPLLDYVTIFVGASYLIQQAILNKAIFYCIVCERVCIYIYIYIYIHAHSSITLFIIILLIVIIITIIIIMKEKINKTVVSCLKNCCC